MRKNNFPQLYQFKINKIIQQNKLNIQSLKIKFAKAINKYKIIGIYKR